MLVWERGPGLGLGLVPEWVQGPEPVRERVPKPERAPEPGLEWALALEPASASVRA